jgi:SAM-dependent methyltransferase
VRDATAVSLPTLHHYDRHAQDYLDFTLAQGIEDNRRLFMEAVEAIGGRRILDLGCGVGRDLRHFRSAGYEAVGLDGAPAMARAARRLSGCPVIVQDMLNLDLPNEAFDGVYAYASLYHMPSQALPAALARLARTLRPGGVLFVCNPCGDDEEGWLDERYICLLSFATWSRLVRAAGFKRITHFYRPPGLPRREQEWLASLWRRL